MSYILDALKKSEQERAQKAEQVQRVAGGQTESDTQQPSAHMELELAETKATQTSWLLRGVYIALLLLSSLVLMKIFESSKDTTEKPLVENSPVEIKITAKEVVAAEVGDQSFQDSSIITDPQVNRIAASTTEPRGIVTNNTAMAIEQAPNDILSELPVMKISSHIYSTQANRRSIVVNDQRLVEGDFVSPGVQVQQITNQGMIVQVKDRLLMVNRSRGWGL